MRGRLSVCVCVCDGVSVNLSSNHPPPPISIYTALELSKNLPSLSYLDRWCGEPVKTVVIPTEVFITNKKGILL